MEISTLPVGWGWSYDQLKAGWQEIEALGFDACYMGDDLFPHYFDDDPAGALSQVEVYDPWTILPVMAETTTRMRIGSMVTPVGRRHPALFAKMTTLVDIISNGRLTVSLGAGNAPDQIGALGESRMKGTQRAVRLEEEVRILHSLWTQERTNFEGEYYTIRDLVSYPKPISRPRPEIQIAFKSKKYLTRLAAEFADRVNLLSNDDEHLMDVLDTLKQHCHDLGRDYQQIKKGRLCCVLFTADEVASDDWGRVVGERAIQIGRDPEDIRQEHLAMPVSYVGPSTGCAEALRKKSVDIGIDELVIMPDTVAQNSYENTMEGLRIFAKDVLPDLKAL